MVKISNFNTKCRSCLTDDDEMHHLFKEFDQNLTLADILKSTTNFQIEEDDGLSAYLCENCSTVLVNFFNFKTIYVENEKYVRSLCIEELYQNNYNEESDNFKTEYTDNNDFSNKELKNIQIHHKSSNETQSDELEQLQITGEFISPKDITNVSENPSLSANIENYNCMKYSCEQCGHSSLLKSDLQQHMLIHNIPISSFEKYDFKVTPQIPMAVKLENKTDIILQCDTCNDKFKTYAEIVEHYKSHKKFVCEHCGAQFLKRSYLTDHAEIHTIEKRHVCPICGKAFRRRTVLVKHKKIHTHPRQCVCEICGLRFTGKGTLKTHIKLKHTKERDFNCTICGLWFPLKSTLMKHIYRHNEGRKREFACKLCNMAYKDKSSLNRHFIIKHTENAIKHICSFCDKRYTTKTNLLKHIRVHHKSLGIKKESVFTENNVIP